MTNETQRMAEAVERARGSIIRARAKLDSIMEDVRALPDALKTTVCHVIEHAFDELLAAERELSDALDVGASEHKGKASRTPPP